VAAMSTPILDSEVEDSSNEVLAPNPLHSAPHHRPSIMATHRESIC
jgi:hypothetical protein